MVGLDTDLADNVFKEWEFKTSFLSRFVTLCPWIPTQVASL